MTIGTQTTQAFYHGTSAGLFGRFSLDHALEGDGKVKFGWGVYVTKNLLLMDLCHEEPPPDGTARGERDTRSFPAAAFCT